MLFKLNIPLKILLQNTNLQTFNKSLLFIDLTIIYFKIVYFNL